MKVRVEPNAINRTVKVWFWEERLDGVAVHRVTGPDTIETTQVEVGATIEPSFTLPQDWLEDLVHEASGIAPASAAQAAHLTDAVTVRDRLLTLIEHQHTS